MRNHEFADPSVPQIQRRGHRLMQGVRCYKVAEVGDIEPNGRIGFKQTMHLATDAGAVGVHKPLVIRSRSKETINKIRAKVEFVAQSEALAYSQYQLHDVDHADFNREVAVRARSELQAQYGITPPKREWDYNKGHGLMDAGQKRMF